MFMRYVTLAISAWLLAVLPASALVNTGNPGGNRNAPTGMNGEPVDPGFAYVGQLGAATGVYLGNGWVLTARNLPPKDLTVNGTTYSWDGVSDYKFPDAALRLYRLARWPDMPALSISSSTPGKGQLVVMVGAGRQAEGQLSYWNVNRAVGDEWAWAEVPSRELGNTAGIVCTEDCGPSWGTNRISGFYPHPKLGALLVTDFSDGPPLGTDFEAQAVNYDTGGAIFTENDGAWELAGIILTVTELYPGQPEVVRPEGKSLRIGSAVFGNLTLSVNLAPYRHRIMEITGLNASSAPRVAQDSAR
jgi:hypothetical protein